MKQFALDGKRTSDQQPEFLKEGQLIVPYIPLADYCITFGQQTPSGASFLVPYL